MPLPEIKKSAVLKTCIFLILSGPVCANERQKGRLWVQLVAASDQSEGSVLAYSQSPSWMVDSVSAAGFDYPIGGGTFIGFEGYRRTEYFSRSPVASRTFGLNVRHERRTNKLLSLGASVGLGATSFSRHDNFSVRGAIPTAKAEIYGTFGLGPQFSFGVGLRHTARFGSVRLANGRQRIRPVTSVFVMTTVDF